MCRLPCFSVPWQNDELTVNRRCFQILTPFLLRRLKSDVTLDVPPKKEIIVYAPLTAKQVLFYTAVVNKTIAKTLGVEKVTLQTELNRHAPCRVMTVWRDCCHIHVNLPLILCDSSPTVCWHYSSTTWATLMLINKRSSV